MIKANVRRRRWINWAACLWAIMFAAPHTWWALGFPFGFPGGLARGRANHLLMMTTWRYYFDVAVIVLSILAIFVALAPIQVWGRSIPRWILRTMAWIASGMLSLRGVAGLIHDGSSDLVWWPTFLVGGILFGSVAWLSRYVDPPTQPAPTA